MKGEAGAAVGRLACPPCPPGSSPPAGGRPHRGRRSRPRLTRSPPPPRPRQTGPILPPTLAQRSVAAPSWTVWNKNSRQKYKKAVRPFDFRVWVVAPACSSQVLGRCSADIDMAAWSTRNKNKNFMMSKLIHPVGPALITPVFVIQI